MMFVASATASSSRSDDDAMSCASRRRNDKEIDAVPPPPFGLMGVAGDLCVPRRRRCPCIASSLILDLASQAPSANVIVFIEVDTYCLPLLIATRPFSSSPLIEPLIGGRYSAVGSCKDPRLNRHRTVRTDLYRPSGRRVSWGFPERSARR